MFIASVFALQQGQVTGEEIPAIRANSTKADVTDGGRELRGIWTIDPGVESDVYFARRSMKERTVTFRTDLDSITLVVPPGQNRDFDIVLAGKTKCRTRISTFREPCRWDGPPGATPADAIPFVIGPDNKIHIEGRINDSAPLDLLFDMGADSIVLYPSGGAKKAGLRIDGTMANAGTGGTSTRPSSRDNRVAIGGWRWDHESVLVVEKQADRADGIVGHPLFDGKVVEIDYDAGVLRITDRVPERLANWTAVPMRFSGTLPAVRVRFQGGPIEFDEWLVLDTGSSASVFLNSGSAEAHGLPGSWRRLGSSRMRGVGEGTLRNEVLLLPKLGLGNCELHDLPLHVEERGGASQEPGGHLGMDVLKRYNTVLDFQNDVAYFAPSSLHDTPYRTDFGWNSWWIALAVVIPLTGIVGGLWFRRRIRTRSLKILAA